MSTWSNVLKGLTTFPRRLARAIFPPAPDEPGEKRGGRWTGLGFRVIFSIGFLSIFAYAAQEDRLSFLRITSLGFLIALAGLLTGAFLGFLFGIPRTVQKLSSDSSESSREESRSDSSGASQPEYRGNTNLEQISDWLTKILVGLTLVQFHEIQKFVEHLVIYLSRGIGGTNQEHNSFVLTLMIFFSVAGFFLGYLLTRLYLPLALRRTDRELSSMAAALQKIDKEVNYVLGRAPRNQGFSAASEERFAGVLEQVRVLAREYERIRATMSPGNDRTRSMELIASQMRALANITAPFMSKLAHSESPGERLAAVTCLQVHPMSEFIDWLADRVVSEQPFIGYQASIALLYAARSLPDRYILRAIQRAQWSLGPELADTDRAKILDQAEVAANRLIEQRSSPEAKD